MRLELIRNLTGDEVLAKSIYGADNKILVASGQTLTRIYIQKLLKLGVFLAYIKDKRLEDISEDTILNDIKQTVLQDIPGLFSSLINMNITASKSYLNNVDELIMHILNSGSANTSLYEVKIYDEYTYVHSVDTAIMSVFLGTTLGYSKDSLQELGKAAILHDIGKMRVPNSILNKKGRLTKEEFEIMKMHPTYGRKILEKTLFFSDKVLDAIEQHHEKVDGTGYIKKLKDKEISDYAKIISLCDVFTAISANRCYRNRFSPNEAYEHILAGSNYSFSSTIVNKFKEHFAIYPLGCCVRLSNGIEGFVVQQNKNFPDRPVVRVIYDASTHESIEPYEINLLETIKLIIKEVV